MTIIITLFNWFKLFIIVICLLNTTTTTAEANATDVLTDDSDFYLNSN